MIRNLTIIILTNRNDHRFINSLKSAQIAKQVLIIDNKSENHWEKLKEEYSFKVIDHPKKVTNFSKVKNDALKEVTTEWVFFLDSDEVLSKNAEEKIIELIAQDLYDAVTIQRTDYFLDKPLNYGETGNISLVRMFKLGTGKFVRNVHEIVEYKGKLGEAEFTILHYSHNSIKEFLTDISKYAHMDVKNKFHNHQENIFQMITYPIGKFLYNYILRLGFLDGYRGIVYAVLMSLHSFYVRVFYYENE